MSLETEEITLPVKGWADASAAPAGKLPQLFRDSPADRWVYGLAAVGLIVLYSLALHIFWAPAHPGVDQNGYLVGGKMFSRTWSSGFEPSDPFAFVGRMWIEGPQGKYFPKYPLGLSFIYAIALKIGGAKWGVTLAFLVSPICMALALGATFLIVRMMAGSFAGVLAILIMACSPVTMGLTNNPNSHASAICFTTCGMYLLLRWWQKNGTARAIGAGFLLGMAATVRYTEGTLVVPMVIVALLNFRRSRKWLRESAYLAAAWAIPILILLAYNVHSFGHLTGYDPTNESTAFSWKYFYEDENWQTMIRQLYDMGLFFILPFSVLGLGMMWRWNWRISLVLLGWILPNIGLYSFYYWAPDGTSIAYLRFFLTIFPALALAAAWSLRKLIDWSARDGATIAPRLSVGVLLAIGCGVNLYTAAADVEADSRNNWALAGASKAVLATCPSGSLIFAQDRWLNFLQLAGDYQLYDFQQFNRAAVQRFAHIDPDQPNGLQPQRAMEIYQRLKDETEPQLIKEQNELMSSALAAGKRVFFLVPRNSLGMATRFLPRNQFASEFVGSWEEPADPRQPPRRPWLGFAPQRWGGSQDANQSTIWEILEAKLRPTPKVRSSGSRKGT